MRTHVPFIIFLFVTNHLFAQTVTRSLDSLFQRLTVTGNIHLELVQSDISLLEILSGGIEEEPEIELRDGELVLKTGSELTTDEAVDARLYYRELASLEILRGGRVISADTLKAKFLELDVVSGGKTELVISVDTLYARVNQGADIILYGRATFQRVDAYTWGNYLAYDVESKEVEARAATGAQVKVWVKESLNASATSGAFIGYRGDPPRKKTRETVGGKVEHSN